MEVHYDEGVANHIGPEPCVAVREDRGEASAGVSIGQPLSRERHFPSADAVDSAEGNMDGRGIASARPARRGRRPWHVQKVLAREPGGPTPDRRKYAYDGPHREGEEP